MNKKVWRNITVLVVIALGLLAGFLFNRTRQSSIPEDSRIVAPAPEQKTQEEVSLPAEEKEIVILATVNGRVITPEAFDQELRNLPAQYQEVFEDDKEEFLNQLVIEEILLQEAERQELENEKEIEEKIEKDREQRKEILIQELIQGITEEVEVSLEEIKKLLDCRILIQNQRSIVLSKSLLKDLTAPISII